MAKTKRSTHQTDLKMLQGTWCIRELLMDGQKVPGSSLENARIVVKKDHFTTSGMGAEYAGTLALDVTKSPKHLTMEFETGPERVNRNLCIYVVYRTHWRLCIA